VTIYRVDKKQDCFFKEFFDNFAMVNGRKACDMSKDSEFCLEKVQNLHVSAFKYSLPSLLKSSIHVKLY